MCIPSCEGIMCKDKSEHEGLVIITRPTFLVCLSSFLYDLDHGGNVPLLDALFLAYVELLSREVC